MRYFTGPSGRADYGPSPAEIVGSNRIGGMDVFVSFVCCLGYIKKYADIGTRTNTVCFRRLLLARVHLPGLLKEIC